MHRFFCGHSNIQKNSSIELTDPKEIHHLKNVLRLKKDDQVVVFNTDGREAVGSILSLSPHAVLIRVDYLRPSIPHKTTRVILACAIPKKSKFETIIEKTTELGVDEIIPLLTQRTIVNLKGDQAIRKSWRYQTIATNAAKQCGRRDVPHIHPATKFSDILKSIDSTTTGFIPNLSQKGQNIVKEIQSVRQPKKVIFLIGPEGDFTPEETAAAMKVGLIPVSLGPLVLKVDTAAIAVISLANLFFNQ